MQCGGVADPDPTFYVDADLNFIQLGRETENKCLAEKRSGGTKIKKVVHIPL